MVEGKKEEGEEEEGEEEEEGKENKNVVESVLCGRGHGMRKC